MNDERLGWHLENWAAWQADHAHDFGRGYPTRASGGFVSRSSQDFSSMVHKADRACARAVDAILDGCTPIEKAAVSHFHLAAVFRFPRLGMAAENAYQSAREKIRRGLLARGIP
jgi:hypothetical protein